MSIIQVKGKVTYPITIDPSVWIFDDRKFPFDSWNKESATGYQKGEEQETLDTERLIREGQIAPPTLKTEKRFEKEKLMNGSFAMKLGTVLKNAEPLESAAQCVFITNTERISVPLDKALESIVHFSESGKPLQEDGPVHIYFADHSNREQPITGLKELEII
ncbi:peptidyl-prolyl cis-trans isomerase [Bacillus atrophaeus]|uniref:peptidyl-prolyl cis-trans isomerase n=1 Tax=Bacillus atrophaeus TaxID=1452 RepID=UPI00227FBC54|nr:peptidyl-prolyl cis-trans isomerase [Bacillus atrophaeus]MCY8974362.1 peptidyl-prolyl cis-trans isomerase [Bacillus atrophaeus]MCY9203323.1 peptidyl-prolyl cis-trans isomerase [Bacillus atrophaeus]MEC0884461.1 peptidyl-prolyl cis-trans isomerase [Bacillus atrophaeus]